MEEPNFGFGFDSDTDSRCLDFEAVVASQTRTRKKDLKCFKNFLPQFFFKDISLEKIHKFII